MEETRIAVISIILSDKESVEQVNSILHDYGSFILGRMGIPYREKGLHLISVAIDAPEDAISALSGKLGRLKGVSVKTAYAPRESLTIHKVKEEREDHEEFQEGNHHSPGIIDDAVRLRRQLCCIRCRFHSCCGKHSRCHAGGNNDCHRG